MPRGSRATLFRRVGLAAAPDAGAVRKLKKGTWETGKTTLTCWFLRFLVTPGTWHAECFLAVVSGAWVAT